MAEEDQEARIAIYPEAGGGVEVRLLGEAIWLTQRQMGEVFGTSPENVLMHLNNIFSDGELEEEATTKEFLVVRQEGKRRVRRRLKHYNLDAILSVGYRVNSKRAVQFRQWATRILLDHLVRGYTLNCQRFKENARELEAALQLVRKAAAAPALDAQAAQGLMEILSHVEIIGYHKE